MITSEIRPLSGVGNHTIPTLALGSVEGIVGALEDFFGGIDG